jgi:hypothetical protein
MQGLDEMTSYARLGRLVGTALPRVLPQDTVIATRMTGALPYYSRLRTVDQWGLNDAAVSRQGVAVDRFQRGHMRVASSAYLASQGVNLVFDHPVVCACDPSCVRQFSSDVLIPLPTGGCVRAAYLVRTPRLTELLCGRGDVLISARDQLCAGPSSARETP